MLYLVSHHCHIFLLLLLLPHTQRACEGNLSALQVQAGIASFPAAAWFSLFLGALQGRQVLPVALLEGGLKGAALGSL